MFRRRTLLAAILLASGFPAGAAFEAGTVLYPDVIARSLALADMDGDGRDDLVMLGDSKGTSWLKIAVQKADGTLSDPVTIELEGDSFFRPNMHLVEMTGDGRPDIAVGAHDKVALLSNQGNLQFSMHAIHFAETYVDHVAADDIDGDGHQDLLAAISGDFAILGGDGSGAITNVSTLPGFGVSTFQMVDVEGDGDLDVAYLSGGHIWIMKRDQTGFTGAIRSHAAPYGMEASDPGFADFNGDGLVDYAIGKRTNSYFNPSVALLLQRPGGRFQKFQVLESHDLPNDAIFHDVDDDGDLDLIVPHTGFFTYGVYRSNGRRLAIEERYEGFAPRERTHIAMGDLNGDGRDDLVAASHIGGIWLLAGRSDVPGPDPAVRASFDENVVTLRLTNDGDAASAEVYLVVDVEARRGAVQADALPSGCSSQPGNNLGVRVICFLPPLAPETTTSVLLPISGIEATMINHLFAKAELSAGIDVRPDNNRASARGLIVPTKESAHIRRPSRSK